ncbi:MAG: exodeoxyribonuclease VII large subunit [Clostridia bacterium]|nr:exodeoxyribonuclease VII large subunit [Clostridia bacterium]
MNGIPEYFKENVLTVSELNGLVKEVFESIPVFSSVRIRGEISNFKRYQQSGHCYFTLKDESSAIKAVMFKSSALHLKFNPADGMRVVARGRLSVFERDGVYQLYATSLEPDGLGALYVAFEALKKKLEAEGLFDPSRKRPLPKYPKTVGVITSPSGAAVRDIINVTGRRFPMAEIKLFPALVQGDGAEEELIAGIEFFNDRAPVDVIIIGRGGGSIEDLWAFNGERLARTVAASAIPVISAVGHETDFTICDFVADKRAPTPSAAAELALPDTAELKRYLTALSSAMARSVDMKLRVGRQRLDALAGKRILRSPDSFLDYRREQLDRMEERLTNACKSALDRKQSRLQLLSGKLNALSPLSVMSRGFGVAFDDKGELMTSASGFTKGKKFTLKLSDGTVNAVSEGYENK